MNWQAVNFDWNQVRAFLATVEEGSLSGAARALGLTQPTLGRQVSALEARLGVTLFERVGRTLILTPTGRELADHVRAMGDAASRLSLAASGQSTSVEGQVKVSASEMFSAFVLPDLIAPLRRMHPGIVIEIVSTNSLSDLHRREADIAVRNTEPTGPDLIACRMPDECGGFFGAPDLITEYGPFETTSDMARAPLIGLGADNEYLEILQSRGVPVTDANIVARSESHLVHWELARKGLGFGINSTNVGRSDLRMRPVLHDVLSFEFPVWLVAPRELKTSRRVRIVFDALVEMLGQRQRGKSKSKSP